MFKTNKDALRITDIQDVASFQDTYVAPATHPPQHSLVHSIWLHLLPGVLIVLFAITVEPMIISAGLPLLLVPSLWVLCVLIPFELGYLLPRMAHLKGWAPLLNTVLFSLQHLFSPWQNLGRILGFLPIAYTVAWKKNISIAIITHCTLDALSATLLLVMLYR